MADNTNVTPGSGEIVASKDLGGVKHQRVLGGFLNPAGTAFVDPSAANPMPVVQTGPVSASLLAGETYVGKVGGATVILPFTPPLLTTAYAAGTVLFTSFVLSGGLRVNGGTAWLTSLVVNDQLARGVPMTIYFAKSSINFGAQGAGETLADAAANNILGCVEIAAEDYKDLTNLKLAVPRFDPFAVVTSTGTTSVHVAAVLGAAGATYGAASLVFAATFAQD